MGVEPIGSASGKLCGIDGRRDGGEVVTDLGDDRSRRFARKRCGRTGWQQQPPTLRRATFCTHRFFVWKVEKPERPAGNTAFGDFDFLGRQTNGNERQEGTTEDEGKLICEPLGHAFQRFTTSWVWK